MISKLKLSVRFFSAHKNVIDWKSLKFPSKVPKTVVASSFSEKTTRTKITEDEIVLLERLSLVDLERT